jgi:hypothetical protein
VFKDREQIKSGKECQACALNAKCYTNLGKKLQLSQRFTPEPKFAQDYKKIMKIKKA